MLPTHPRFGHRFLLASTTLALLLGADPALRASDIPPGNFMPEDPDNPQPGPQPDPLPAPQPALAPDPDAMDDPHWGQPSQEARLAIMNAVLNAGHPGFSDLAETLRQAHAAGADPTVPVQHDQAATDALEQFDTDHAHLRQSTLDEVNHLLNLQEAVWLAAGGDAGTWLQHRDVTLALHDVTFTTLLTNRVEAEALDHGIPPEALLDFLFQDPGDVLHLPGGEPDADAPAQPVQEPGPGAAGWGGSD